MYPTKPMNGGRPLNGLFFELLEDPDWACEAKLNGKRGHWDGETLWSRTGNKLYDKVALAEYLAAHYPGTPLDGEIVGDFFWIFDLPGMAEEPYRERRTALQALWEADVSVMGEKSLVRLTPYVADWSDVEDNLYEGVVFKRLESRYKMHSTPGKKIADWIKFRKENL